MDAKEIIEILHELVDEVENATEFEFGYLIKYADRILAKSKEEAEVSDVKSLREKFMDEFAKDGNYGGRIFKEPYLPGYVFDWIMKQSHHPQPISGKMFIETKENNATHVVHEYGTNKTIGVIEFKNQ